MAPETTARLREGWGAISRGHAAPQGLVNKNVTHIFGRTRSLSFPGPFSSAEQSIKCARPRASPEFEWGPFVGFFLMLRSSASGLEIGFPGQISAGFSLGEPQNRPSRSAEGPVA